MAFGLERRATDRLPLVELIVPKAPEGDGRLPMQEKERPRLAAGRPRERISSGGGSSAGSGTGSSAGCSRLDPIRSDPQLRAAAPDVSDAVMYSALVVFSATCKSRRSGIRGQRDSAPCSTACLIRCLHPPCEPRSCISLSSFPAPAFRFRRHFSRRAVQLARRPTLLVSSPGLSWLRAHSLSCSATLLSTELSFQNS